MRMQDVPARRGGRITRLLHTLLLSVVGTTFGCSVDLSERCQTDDDCQAPQPFCVTAVGVCSSQPEVPDPDGGAGGADASSPDMSIVDAAQADAGEPTPDSAGLDEGLEDMALPDVGAPDAERPDAEAPDAAGPDACVPQAEDCNDLDDDCDGRVDEGGPGGESLIEGCYGGPEGTAGVGNCTAGERICLEGGNWGACELQVVPSPEACDGEDDDCDGTADENYGLGEVCEVGLGACAAEGMVICDGNGGTTCDAQEGVPAAEICDGLDNDCDGQIDEQPEAPDVPTLAAFCQIQQDDPRLIGPGPANARFGACVNAACVMACEPGYFDGDNDLAAPMGNGCERGCTLSPLDPAQFVPAPPVDFGPPVITTSGADRGIAWSDGERIQMRLGQLFNVERSLPHGFMERHYEPVMARVPGGWTLLARSRNFQQDPPFESTAIAVHDDGGNRLDSTAYVATEGGGFAYPVVVDAPGETRRSLTAYTHFSAAFGNDFPAPEATHIMEVVFTRVGGGVEIDGIVATFDDFWANQQGTKWAPALLPAGSNFDLLGMTRQPAAPGDEGWRLRFSRYQVSNPQAVRLGAPLEVSMAVPERVSGRLALARGAGVTLAAYTTASGALGWRIIQEQEVAEQRLFQAGPARTDEALAQARGAASDVQAVALGAGFMLLHSRSIDDQRKVSITHLNADGSVLGTATLLEPVVASGETAQAMMAPTDQAGTYAIVWVDSVVQEDGRLAQIRVSEAICQ